MRLAVYTTLYPAMLPWLGEWHDSLLRQTDRDFALWIGLDGLRPEDVEQKLCLTQPICWVQADPGDTPAELRNRALSFLMAFCDGVVLVDSDDRLLPDRIEAARRSLAHCELTGCALRLIDGDGHSLGREFSAAGLDPEEILPRWNAFGFSNSAIQVSLLAHCLPVPPETILMDWMVATRAWLSGAALAFDPVPRMEYRQYGSNTARLPERMDAAQVASDAVLVARHFRLLLATLRPKYRPDRVAILREAAADVDRFIRTVVNDRAQLVRYVDAFHAAPPAATIWWNAVAYPPLSFMWNVKNEEKVYENTAIGSF